MLQDHGGIFLTTNFQVTHDNLVASCIKHVRIHCFEFVSRRNDVKRRHRMKPIVERRESVCMIKFCELLVFVEVTQNGIEHIQKEMYVPTTAKI